MDCTFVGTEFRNAKLTSADLRLCQLGKIALHDMARDMKGAIISTTQAADLLQDFGLVVA